MMIAVLGGVSLETVPILLQATNETCWGIRPPGSVSGTLRAGTRQARLVAGTGIAYLRNPNGISYPRATIFGLHWVIWFLVLSTIAGVYTPKTLWGSTVKIFRIWARLYP